MLGSIDFNSGDLINPDAGFDVADRNDGYELMSYWVAGVPALNVPATWLYFIQFRDEQGDAWYSSASPNEKAVRDAISLLTHEVIGKNFVKNYTNH